MIKKRAGPKMYFVSIADLPSRRHHRVREDVVNWEKNFRLPLATRVRYDPEPTRQLKLQCKVEKEGAGELERNCHASYCQKPPSQRLVDIVGALGGNWSGYNAMCRCPAHADATPSLSLRQGDNDILVHCFAGCDPADVLRELATLVPGRTYAFPDGPSRPFNSTAIARNLWSQGRELANTWGEAYCRYRGIVGRHDDLRYLARCPKGRKPNTGLSLRLLVGVREGRDIKAVQRIFLKPEGQGYRSKLMIGKPASRQLEGNAPHDPRALGRRY